MSKSVSPNLPTQQVIFQAEEIPILFQSLEELFKENVSKIEPYREKVPAYLKYIPDPTILANNIQFISQMYSVPSRAYLFRLLPDTSDKEKWAHLSSLMGSINPDVLTTTFDVISTNVQQIKPCGPDDKVNLFWRAVGQRIFNALDSNVGKINPVQMAIKEIEAIRLEVLSMTPKTRTKRAFF